MKGKQPNKLYGFKMAGLYWLGSAFLPLKILLTILPVLIYFVLDLSDETGMGMLFLFVTLAVFSDVIVGMIYLKLVGLQHGHELYTDILGRFMIIDETDAHYDFDVSEIIRDHKYS